MALLLGYKKQLVEDKHDLDVLMEMAHKRVEEMTSGSRLLEEAPHSHRIPSLMHTEVYMGKLLGTGGFGTVFEVKRVELDEDAESTDTTVIELSNSSRTYPGYELFVNNAHVVGSTKLTPRGKQQVQRPRETVQDRDFIAQNYRRKSGRKLKARYAVKRMKDSCLNRAEDFLNGAIDLAIEAKFLSVLRHSNIIKMRATAMTDPFSAEDPYFIVLDKLDGILSHRLKAWAKRETSLVNKIVCRKNTDVQFWVERIKVVHDVANAMKYLHSKRVLYRDIKPENIGFDVRGDVKVFDFGLAKELDLNKARADGTYKLTAKTGSIRYMAPEVLLGKPYNERADVYSVTVLLWQVLSLQTPYSYYLKESTFQERVAHMGRRPLINPEWPSEIKKLLHNGWSHDISKRPRMAQLSLALKYELDQHDMEEVIDFEKPFDLHLDTDFDDEASYKSELSYMRLVEGGPVRLQPPRH